MLLVRFSYVWPFKALWITLPHTCGLAGSTSSIDGPVCRIISFLSLHLSVHPSVVCILSPAHSSQLTRPSGRPVHPQLPGMALVTLQRSPTPSAASSASTATTTAAEVSLGPWWTKAAPVWRGVDWKAERMWVMLPEKGPLVEAKLALL